jgi:hypothetical protein
MVREGLAGTRHTCACGRVITVPPLHELRRQAGLPPYELSPELVIEHLLASGELPPDQSCVLCGIDTDHELRVRTECERVQVRTEGGFSVALAVLAMLLTGWLILLRRRGPPTEYGRDKIYTLPLPLCPECRPALRNEKDVKAAMRQVPEYCRLLDKFPDAVLYWTSS